MTATATHGFAPQAPCFREHELSWLLEKAAIPYDPTSWRMILAAGQGDESQRRSFVDRYEALIRGCLRRRWRDSSRTQWLGDACQEVYLECFREGGVLARMRDRRPIRFRAYLMGVIQNVARSFEVRSGRPSRAMQVDEVMLSAAATDDDDLLAWFEREWARSILREALGELAADPATLGSEHSAAELLELRFQRGLPIREIASQWSEEPAVVHRDYARARTVFHACLRRVVCRHDDLPPAEVDGECRQILKLLS